MDEQKQTSSTQQQPSALPSKTRRILPSRKWIRHNRPGLEEGRRDDDDQDDSAVQPPPFGCDRPQHLPLMAASDVAAASNSVRIKDPVGKDAPSAIDHDKNRSNRTEIVDIEIGVVVHGHRNEQQPFHEQDLDLPSSSSSMPPSAIFPTTEFSRAPATVVHQDPPPTFDLSRQPNNEFPGAYRIDGNRAESEADISISDADTIDAALPMSQQMQQLYDRVEVLQQQVREANSTVTVAAEVVNEEHGGALPATSRLAASNAEELATASASVESANIPLVEAQPIDDGRLRSTGGKRRTLIVGGCIFALMAALVVTVSLVLTNSGGQSVSTAVPTTQPTPAPTSPSFKCFDDLDELYDAVDLLLVEPILTNSTLANTYGWPIGNWCISNVTSLTSLFSSARNRNAASFNEDVSGWNVSRVTSMSDAFYNASVFNQDLSAWDVSNVVDMSGMFYLASAFNQDLSTWDVSAVRDMSFMFCSASSFNQNLSTWDISSATDLSSMFYGASSFNQEIPNWNVSAVTKMNAMFSFASAFNQDLSMWNVSSVSEMSWMFSFTSAFNQSLSMWNVSSVTDMSQMFYSALAFNQDISTWDVSRVVDMAFMFSEASAFNQDLSMWSVSRVNNTNSMFAHAASFNQNLSAWAISSVDDMGGMFYNASSFRQDLCHWGRMLSTNVGFLSFNGDGIFDLTDCPNMTIPNMMSNPPGPFCFNCL